MPIEGSVFTRYRPVLQTLTQMETLQAARLLTYEYEPEVDMGEIDFITRASDRGAENPLFTRRIGAYFEGSSSDIDPESLDVAGFEITYNFPYYRRPNLFRNIKTGRSSTYGSGHFSYRMLYEFLCQVWNDGEYFVSAYLNGEFKQTPVYDRFRAFRRRVLKKMADELKEKKQGLYQKAQQVRLRDVQGRFVSPDRVAEKDIQHEYMRMSKGWDSFQTLRDRTMKAELDSIGKDIREQIITALSTGALSLRKESVTPETERRKAALGFTNPSAVFYASGQLIEHLSIYIALDKETA